MPRRRRRVHSVKEELLRKSREAALASVQIFNSPNITFKAEIFIVLIVIAWTYLLHAYFRTHMIEYRYFKMRGQRRNFDRTKQGAYKYWELERCLNDSRCPVDRDAANNLRFLIGLRHEIEHQMTTQIDDLLSARFQACCLNYNDLIKQLFGSKYGIDHHLSVSLQFSGITDEQVHQLEGYTELPESLLRYIQGFDENLSEEEFASPRYAYRVLFVPKTVNHPGQADRVIEFIRAGTEMAEAVNTQYAVIRETERPKWLPGQVVRKMKEEGFIHFGIQHHTSLWKDLDTKDSSKGFGVQLANTWYWYDRWVDVVRAHCKHHVERYK